MITLDIVVIGLNEEKNLIRCLTSARLAALRVAGKLFLKHVVYVDSRSTDKSVEVAASYADTVLRATSKSPASAARSAGLSRCQSDWVLFLDGDMELHPGWFDAVLPLLQEEDVAGLIGERDDIYVESNTGRTVGERKNVYGVLEARVAPHIGGALLVRRSVIVATGGYRKDLAASEEPDLYARIKRLGWNVLEMPVPFVRHYIPVRARGIKSYLSVLRRVARSSIFFGVSFLYSIRCGYWPQLFSIFPWTTSVWIIDSLSVAAAAAGVWKLAAVFEIALIFIFLTLGLKYKILLTARLRLLGLVVAPFVFIWKVARKNKVKSISFYVVTDRTDA
jgi:glycosyltransferase involved in cell wall biosynthesis